MISVLPVPTTRKIRRREFLRLSSMAAAGLIAGCATNPVTGRSQLMLVSEDEEIQIDKQNSPYQFSADYGTVQDKKLNDYIDRTGKNIAVTAWGDDSQTPEIDGLRGGEPLRAHRRLRHVGHRGGVGTPGRDHRDSEPGGRGAELHRLGAPERDRCGGLDHGPA